MDPYKTPESNLEKKWLSPPREIVIVYFLIAASFIIFLIEEILFAITSEDGVTDLYNYIFIPIWGGILFWFTSHIFRRKENPKGTFLFLAVIIIAVSVIEPLTPYSIYTGVVEALCFLCAYLLLRRATVQSWFGSA